MIFFLTVILIVLLNISINKYKNILNPITVFLGINIFALLLMKGMSSLDSYLSPKVWFLISISFASYLFGIFLGNFKFRFSSYVSESYIKKTSRSRLLNLIVIYSFFYNISAFIYLWKINSIFGLKGILNRLTEMNVAYQSGEINFGLINLFIPMGIPLALMVMYYIKNFSGSSLLYIQYILCFIPGLSPRRDTLFYLIFFSSIFILLNTNHSNQRYNFKKNYKLIAIGASFVWIMNLSQSLLNKSIQQEFRLFNIPIPSYLNEVLLYIAGNYPYLEKMHSLGQLKFEYLFISTLRIPYLYFYRFLGVELDTQTIFDLPFVNIGRETNLHFNTVPAMYYFIKESGLFYFVAFIILGLLAQKFYIKFQRSRSVGSLLLLSYLYWILFFSFRSYNVIYLSSILMLIYILIVCAVVDTEGEDS